MARARRSASIGIRERYRAWLVELDDLYGYLAPVFAQQIARVDAGDTIRCHAYEVDLLPPSALVEIAPDGTVTLPLSSSWVRPH